MSSCFSRVVGIPNYWRGGEYMKKTYSAPAIIEQRTFAFETKQSGKHGGHKGGNKPGKGGWPW